jgi:hypothetical protein
VCLISVNFHEECRSSHTPYVLKYADVRHITTSPFGTHFCCFICCSTRTLGELDERFQFKSNKSRLVKEDAQGRGPTDGIADSQFEGLLLECRL